MSASAGFEAFIAHQDGCVVVVVHGEVDMASALGFDALIEEALKASPNVVFDMAGVTFIDSTGIRSLLFAWREVKDAGSVTIRNAAPIVKRVIHLAGVDSVIALEDEPVAAPDSGTR